MVLQLIIQGGAYTKDRKAKVKQAPFSTQRALGQRWHTRVGPGIKAAAEKLKLTLSKESNVSEFEYLGDATNRFHMLPTKKNTKVNYEGHLRMFWRYAAIKGDYESMLMLLKEPPKNCPSMNLNTLEEYMRFKRLEPGEPLLDLHGTQVHDVFGTPITCEGGWIAPKNVKIFRAAIYDLHIANNQVAEYEEPCEDCRQKPKERRHEGCEHHLGRPVCYRRGNPTRHQTFKNTTTNMDNVAIQNGYQETGSSQLLPSDLRLLGVRYLSNHSRIDFRDWVINILSTKQALRHDEFHTIHEDNFLPEHFQITDDRIDSLAFQVYGKADKRWCKLRLHADHEKTDLCPVRALLIYLYLIGWKGGYIFPKSEELRNPPSDGIYKTHIDYQSFLDDLKKVCQETLPSRTPELKIGCQIFRKTFYVLGIFGKGAACDLKASARHKSDLNSQAYRKSAMMDYETHKNSPVAANGVSKWKHILIDQTSGNTMLLAAMGGCKTKPIADLPDYFVHTILRVDRDSPCTKNKNFLIEKARAYVPVDSPAQKMAALLARLPVEESSLLSSILQDYIKEQVQQILAQNNPALLAATAGTCNPPEPQIQSADAASPLPNTATFCSAITVPVTLPNRPKRKHGIDGDGKQEERNDLDGHSEVMDLANSRLKLEAMIRLAKVKKESLSPLTNRAKVWASRYLTPVTTCLKNHFGDNPDLFLAAHPAYHPSSFPKHCKGNDQHCHSCQR